jgi:hypothetical protein
MVCLTVALASNKRPSRRWSEVSADRNFPCQTLKIRNVSLVVMGS